jgi:hypothetical protein
MRNILVLCLALWSAMITVLAQTVNLQDATASQSQVKKIRYVSPSVKKTVQATGATAVASAPLVSAYAGVFTGKMTCEFGQVIRVSEDDKDPGTFYVQTPKALFRMSQVSTSTGAVRLEDAKQGALWLQLPAKSMLMDTRRGQRLADECKSPEQVAVSEQMKQSPQQNLLEGQAELAKK